MAAFQNSPPVIVTATPGTINPMLNRLAAATLTFDMADPVCAEGLETPIAKSFARMLAIVTGSSRLDPVVPNRPIIGV